jgi:Trk K+ transport system NAD-binding subunit
VENYLDRPGVAELFEIGSGAASLVSVAVPDHAEVHGKPIRDLNLPEECVVAAVIREQEFLVPRGKTVIESGDHVVLVGSAEAIRDANVILVRKSRGGPPHPES